MPKRIASKGPSVRRWQAPANWKSITKSLEPWMKRGLALKAEFKQMRDRYGKLKKSAMAAVTRWEWYSNPAIEMDPMHFVLSHDEECVPGRLLKRQPDVRTGKIHYGFDAANRMVVEDRFSISTEFREYAKDQISGVCFHWSKECIGVQRLFLNAGRPHVHLRCGKSAISIRMYVYRGNDIVNVVRAHRSDEGTTSEFLLPSGKLRQPQWQLSVDSVKSMPSGLIEIRTELAVPSRGGETLFTRYRVATMPQSGTKPTLDLRSETKRLRPIIEGAIARFAKKDGRMGSPVSAIGLVFQWYVNGTPRVHVNFDKRIDHKLDGSWTDEVFEVVSCPEWEQFHRECELRRGGTLIDIKGREHKIRDIVNDCRPTDWFGEALAELLKQLETTRALKTVKKAANFQMTVEDIGYDFLWRRPGRPSAGGAK